MVPASSVDAVDPQQAAAIGAWLRDRRLKAGRRPEDFITPLRTTTHQLLALEHGRLSVFYGPSFYRALVLRYATALGANTADLERISSGQAPDGADLPQTAVDPVEQPVQQPDQAATSDLTIPPEAEEEAEAEAEVEPEPESDAVVVALASAPVAPDLPASPKKTGGSWGLGGLLLILLIGAGFYYWLVQAGVPAPPRADVNPVSTAPVDPVPASGQQPDPAHVLAGSQALASSETQSTDEVTVALEGPPGPLASPPPGLRLVATADTWIWMRMPNNEVRQLAVAIGEPLEVPLTPIYLVVSNPSVVQAWVSGQPITLTRNDPNRNYARLTAEDLAAAARGEAASQ